MNRALTAGKGERWSEWSKYTETNTTYITLCFTMYIQV